MEGRPVARALDRRRPLNPGRLNDLPHIVYKAADASVAAAQSRIDASRGHPQKRIGGEALIWAHERLRARSEQRRILMVISDGAPVDEPTLSVNPGDYPRTPGRTLRRRPRRQRPRLMRRGLRSAFSLRSRQLRAERVYWLPFT
jgi:cobalamin biosynthesis protein CobT